MDPKTIFIISQTITTTQVVSGSLSIATSQVVLAADAVQVFGVLVGWLLIHALFLFVSKFQQWALILSLICTLVWLPFSFSPLSVIAAACVLFFLMIAAVLRTLSNLFK